MEFEAQGVLKFRSAATRDQALAAFDARAHGEFYSSEMFRTFGKYAEVSHRFDLAADCDPAPAFEAVAEAASDGAVDWGSRRDPAYQRVTFDKRKKVVVGVGWSADAFGGEGERRAEAWRADMDKARAKAAALAAKEAAQARKHSVELDIPGSARCVVARASGGFAVMSNPSEGATLTLLDVDGAVVSQLVVAADGFRGERLTELLDGRLVVAPDFGDRVLVVDPSTGDVAEHLLGRGADDAAIVPVPGGFVWHGKGPKLVTRDGVVTLDTEGVDAEFPEPGTRWGDRFVITTLGHNVVYSATGERLLTVDGGPPVAVGDHLFTSYDGAVLIDGEGERVPLPLPTDCRLLLLEEGVVGYRGRSRWKRYDREWNQVWSSQDAHSGQPVLLSDRLLAVTPVSYPPSGSITLIDLASGATVGTVLGKGEIVETLRLDDATLVARVERGAHNRKLHVFRNLDSTPEYLAIAGHAEPIVGFAVGGEAVVTWSTDGTARLFRPA